MKKYDVVLVDLNQIIWSEQSWIRPCIIIQNDFANEVSRTFVIAIISSKIKEYPHTLIINSSKENGLKCKSRIDFLQVRTIDKIRIIKRLGILENEYKISFNEKIKIAYWL